MAQSELKSTASSIKSEAKSAVNSNLSAVKSTVGDTLRDAKSAGEKFLADASPKVREQWEQFQDVAGDFYKKANTWMEQGNNRNYAFLGLAAAVGLAGFFIGRAVSGSSSSSSSASSLT